MFSKRAKALGLMSFLFFFLLSTRLIYISVQNGAAFETMAQKQQKRELVVAPIRGDITDRHGISFTDKENKRLYFSAGGEISEEATENTVFDFEIKKREPAMAQHLIGYTTRDGEGKSGMEKLYDSILKTDASISLGFRANAQGQPVDQYELSAGKPSHKISIRLTIDYHIQKAVEAVMDKHIKKGAAVIVDVQSFDVLAMVSRPSYETEKLELYSKSPDGELLNRALLGYNAGSVFKIVTATAALEKNAAIKDRFFDCRGTFDLGDGHVFSCHEKQGHGILSFDDALAFSCNCSFYLTGLETGAKEIINTARDFGMGAELLNSKIGENSGNLPVREIYSNAEALNLSIGQGEILITPLQCAVMAATVANGGIRRDANLVSDFITDGAAQDVRNTGSTRVMEQSTSLMLSRMMRECVLHGTAEAASGSKTAIAGKTGSAQSGWVENGLSLVHGWFCGFFPYESPRYAMAILSEGGNSGAGSCVAPFVEIAEEINKIYPFKQ